MESICEYSYQPPRKFSAELGNMLRRLELAIDNLNTVIKYLSHHKESKHWEKIFDDAQPNLRCIFECSSRLNFLFTAEYSQLGHVPERAKYLTNNCSSINDILSNNTDDLLDQYCTSNGSCSTTTTHAKLKEAQNKRNTASVGQRQHIQCYSNNHCNNDESCYGSIRPGKNEDDEEFSKMATHDGNGRLSQQNDYNVRQRCTVRPASNNENVYYEKWGRPTDIQELVSPGCNIEEHYATLRKVRVRRSPIEKNSGMCHGSKEKSTPKLHAKPYCTNIHVHDTPSYDEDNQYSNISEEKSFVKVDLKSSKTEMADSMADCSNVTKRVLEESNAYESTPRRCRQGEKSKIFKQFNEFMSLRRPAKTQTSNLMSSRNSEHFTTNLLKFDEDQSYSKLCQLPEPKHSTKVITNMNEKSSKRALKELSGFLKRAMNFSSAKRSKKFKSTDELCTNGIRDRPKSIIFGSDDDDKVAKLNSIVEQRIALKKNNHHHNVHETDSRLGFTNYLNTRYNRVHGSGLSNQQRTMENQLGNGNGASQPIIAHKLSSSASSDSAYSSNYKQKTRPVSDASIKSLVFAKNQNVGCYHSGYSLDYPEELIDLSDRIQNDKKRKPEVSIPLSISSVNDLNSVGKFQNQQRLLINSPYTHSKINQSCHLDHLAKFRSILSLDVDDCQTASNLEQNRPHHYSHGEVWTCNPNTVPHSCPRGHSFSTHSSSSTVKVEDPKTVSFTNGYCNGDQKTKFENCNPLKESSKLLNGFLEKSEQNSGKALDNLDRWLLSKFIAESAESTEYYSLKRCTLPRIRKN